MKPFWQFAVLGAAACSGCSPSIDGRESAGDKHEWSILQVQEYVARQQLVAKPTFSSSDGYVLLTVPSQDRSENIWIMLSPESPPFYKQMPQGSYAISRNLFDVVVKQRIASSTLKRFLLRISRSET
jgi:hypothetical protein